MEHKEDIDEWQQIEHRSPETSGWNTIVINENYIEVGSDQASSPDDPPSPTPTHHELSLQIVPTTIKDPEAGTSSPLTPSSSATVSDEEGVPAPPPLDWRVRAVNDGQKLLKLRLEAMRERVVGVASKVSNWAMCTGVFWSFTHVTGAAAVAAVLVSLVYVGIRQRRRRVGRRNVVDRWVCLLREKDEKISQLLFQIAQLNEVLSSRRKVPVHQIN
ncbi:hypothetical protein E2542_SST15982 [Spatholobus suberectus]|nr:hypothetical protein E2542_SST15982 [Spatholobus suberectus]